MSESNIMSCLDQIPYDKLNIIKTLEEESIKTLGQEKWNDIISGIEVPFDDMEHEKLNIAMRVFLKRYNERVSFEVSQNIFCQVKHGLKHGDFTWARDKFLQYNDIDAFCAAMRRETIEGFTQSAKDGSYFAIYLPDEIIIQYVHANFNLASIEVV